MKLRTQNGAEYQGSASDPQTDRPVFQEGRDPPGLAAVPPPQPDELHGDRDRVHLHLRGELPGHQGHPLSQRPAVPRIRQVRNYVNASII